MLLLYRSLLIGFIVAVAISYSQGAKARGANGFLWALTGIALFLLGLIILGATVSFLATGRSAIDSLASTLGVTCIPLLAALYARTRFLPGSPLFSLPTSFPVVPVTIVTVGLTIFLIANEIEGSLLAGVVKSLAGPSGGGRAGQLELMGTLANVKGAIFVSTIGGWFMIATYFALRARRKRRRLES